MLEQTKYTLEEKYPDSINSLKEHKDYFEFISHNKVHLRVYFINELIVRFRYAELGLFEDDFSYAIDPKFNATDVEITKSETSKLYTFSTEKLVIHISKTNMKVSILDSSGSVMLDDEKGYHWEEHPVYGGNIVQMTKSMKANEAFLGLGDQPTHNNLAGKRINIWGTDEYGFKVHGGPLYKNIPFFYGLRDEKAYGVFFDNSFESFFDFGSERTDVYSYWAMGGEMNYYFIYGPEMMSVAQSYSHLTGKPDMPPLWALGYQQSKWSYYPESVVKKLASDFRTKNLPCDVIHIDIDYMDGFRCFTWDKEKFPDPARMIEELHAEGFKVVIILDPGIKIDFEYPVFKEALEKGYFCKRMDGSYMNGKVWPGNCFFPDFTKAEVRDWWAGLFRELIQEQKVDGVWNDMNEPALFEVKSKTFPLDVRHDYDGHPCSHRKAHNVYGMQMARASYEGVERFNDNLRPFVFTRSCYAGIQRFAGAWTGDNIATWEHLWVASVQVQNISISGLSYIGTDVGGFIENPTGELYIRWMQLGIFHPFFRTHSSGDHGDQEPWSFGPEVEAQAKRCLEIRYRLLPYLYTTFFQNHKYGMPFIRPMVFESQTDEKCLHQDETFMVGDHMIHSPILKPGVMEKNLYLPKGQWYNVWSEKLFKGEGKRKISSSLEEPIIMLRAGSVVPLFPIQQYVGEIEFSSVQFKISFTNQVVHSLYYDDDGKTSSYASGQYQLHHFFTQSSGSVKKIQHKVEGDYSSPRKYFIFEILGLTKVKKIKIDGKEVEMNPKNIAVENDFEIIEIYS